MLMEEFPTTTGAILKCGQVPSVDSLSHHFLLELLFIAFVSKSPYQITLGPVTSTVPKTIGIGLPCSAVGMSKSESEAGLGFGGFGASAYATNADTISTAI